MKTLKNLFKPDQFNEEALSALFQQNSQYTISDRIVRRAQQILDQYIKENGVKVFGPSSSEGSDKHYAQKAKCKHCNTPLKATWEPVDE